MAIEQFANLANTVLNGAINDSVTSIDVASATGFSSSVQFRINVEDELMLVTAGAGTTTWTVTRGIEGTTAASHANGAKVAQVLTAGALAWIKPTVSSGPYASLPANPVVGERYYCTDSPYILEWTGTEWLTTYNGRLVTRPDQFIWTWENQSTNSVDVSKGYSRITGAAAGVALQLASPTLSATPTVEAYQWVNTQSSGGFPTFGIALVNASNQLYGFVIGCGSAGDLRVSAGYGTAYSFTTFQFDSFVNGTNGSVGATGAALNMNSHLQCLRAVYGVTNCEAQYSDDGGNNWVTFSSIARATALPGGAPNRIGLYFSPNSRQSALTTYHVRVF